MNPKPHLMTVQEVADYLKVSQEAILEWAASGELSGQREGANWQFSQQQVNNWLDKQLYALKNPRFDMPIRKLIHPSRIHLLDVDSKIDLLNFLINQASSLPGIASRAEVADATFKREDLMSTGIGQRIAVPHVRLNSVKNLFVFIAVNNKDILDYKSLDGSPVRVAVFFVVGLSQHAEYIKALSIVLDHLKNALVFRQVVESSTPGDAFAALTGVNP